MIGRIQWIPEERIVTMYIQAPGMPTRKSRNAVLQYRPEPEKPPKAYNIIGYSCYPDSVVPDYGVVTLQPSLPEPPFRVYDYAYEYDSKDLEAYMKALKYAGWELTFDSGLQQYSMSGEPYRDWCYRYGNEVGLGSLRITLYYSSSPMTVEIRIKKH